MAAETSVTYLSPAWGLIPEMKHGFHAVHVRVKFEEASGSVELVHNFNLPYGDPLQPPKWIEPIVVVNPFAGGVKAPLHTVTIKDGNTLVFGRVATGEGTAVSYDVWIFRPKGEGWFANW